MSRLFTKEKIAKNAPSATGVYIFLRRGLAQTEGRLSQKIQDVLYVGKAVNIKARLLSHLQNARFDSKEAAIVKGADKIKIIPTESEFKALVLEAQLIQKYHPRYNTRWKDNKSYLYVKITIGADFPKVLLARGKEINRELGIKNQELCFGPFSSVRVSQEILRGVRRVVPFCIQKQITKQPCFYSKIGLCNPCPNVVAHLKDEKQKQKLQGIYQKNIKAVIKILQGRYELILADLQKQIKQLASKQKYEKALQLRNRLFRLQYFVHEKSLLTSLTEGYDRTDEALTSLRLLLHSYFPTLKSLHRIECYDVSNLQLKEATASMVVFTNGLADKSQYRKFKIKKSQARSDFEMLEEVLTRRFRNNWRKPVLLVVDGGAPQVRVFQKVLQKLKIEIPLIGIAKTPDRLIIPTATAATFTTLKPAAYHLGFNLIRHLRDESHRFARKYHLLLRSKKFLI